MNPGAWREVVDSAQLHLFPHPSPLLTFHSPPSPATPPTAHLTTRDVGISLQSSQHPQKVAPLKPQLPHCFRPITHAVSTCEYEAEYAAHRQCCQCMFLHRTCLVNVLATFRLGSSRGIPSLQELQQSSSLDSAETLMEIEVKFGDTTAGTFSAAMKIEVTARSSSSDLFFAL